MTRGPLREYEFKDVLERGELVEGDIESLVGFLGRLQPGEKLTTKFHINTNSQDISKLQSCVEGLKRCGTDIGKGDAEYGFKMPIPEKDSAYRDLVIFRRKK